MTGSLESRGPGVSKLWSATNPPFFIYFPKQTIFHADQNNTVRMLHWIWKSIEKWRHRDRSKLATTSGGNAYGPCVQYACVGMYRTSSVVIFLNGHFLRPTTSAKSISWVSTIILGEKNLAPSKVGQTENFQTCLMDYSSKCRFPRSALQTSPYDVRKTTKLSTTCTYYREILTVWALVE